MELSEIKQELEKITSRVEDFRGLFDLEQKKARIAELEALMADPAFWDDQNQAQTVIQESNGLKSYVDSFEEMEETLDNLEVSYELVKEENDQELFEDLQSELKDFKERVNKFELQLLLSEPYDANNAILELHPGAGGTESQDWASMLLRMYQRWAESHSFSVETIDYLPGDEAGVKSVTLLIKGHNVYGYLKAEKGVHRLVRISPFDSSGDGIHLLYPVM